MINTDSDFELLALLHAYWELDNRNSKRRSAMPEPLALMTGDQSLAFYYGIVNEIQVPQTVSECIAENIAYYQAGSLSAEIIELRGQK